MPRLARYIISATLLGLLGASLNGAGAQSLRPGTEVFAVDPGKVIKVTYRSAGIILTAHRRQTRDRFTLVFLAKNRQAVSCLAGPEFDVVLNQLTNFRLRRALNDKEAEEVLKKNPLSSWAEVVVRDNTALEPFRALLLPVAGVPNEAFIQFNDFTYVVDFADKVFQLISNGCKLLAGTSPHQE
jgi:hypothetical protein